MSSQYFWKPSCFPFYLSIERTVYNYWHIATFMNYCLFTCLGFKSPDFWATDSKKGCVEIGLQLKNNNPKITQMYFRAVWKPEVELKYPVPQPALISVFIYIYNIMKLKPVLHHFLCICYSILSHAGEDYSSSSFLLWAFGKENLNLNILHVTHKYYLRCSYFSKCNMAHFQVCFLNIL